MGAIVYLYLTHCKCKWCIPRHSYSLTKRKKKKKFSWSYLITRSGFFFFSIFNPNSHALFFVSRLSPGKGRGPKMGVPPWVSNRGPRAPQCTVHPWHATRVSLSGQRFRSHMRPASMM